MTLDIADDGPQGGRARWNDKRGPQRTAVSFLPDFCQALAHALMRFSSGHFEEIATHVAISGEIWYVQLSHAQIYSFALLHERGAIPESTRIVLEAQRQAQRLTLQLEAGDLQAVFFVCDKINAGAAAVPLIGELEVEQIR